MRPLMSAEVSAAMRRVYEEKRKTETSRFHRSIASLTIEPIAILHTLLLTPALVLGLVYGKPYLMALWNNCIIFWLDLLGIPIKHDFTPEVMAGMNISRLLELPPIIQPSTITLAGNAVFVLAAFYVSIRIPDQKMPVKVLIRLLSAVHGAAVAFFILSPWPFPHAVGEQISANLSNGYGIMLASPIAFGLGYYLLSEKLSRKIGYSLIFLFYYALLVPHKAVFELMILYHFSSLFMPLLYLCFGPIFAILLFVAFYSFMISNVPTQKARF